MTGYGSTSNVTYAYWTVPELVTPPPRTATVEFQKLHRSRLPGLSASTSPKLVPDLVLGGAEFAAGSTRFQGQVAVCVACAKAALTVVIKWKSETTWLRLLREACRFAAERFTADGFMEAV